MHSISPSVRPTAPMGLTAKVAVAAFGAATLGTGSIYALDRAESWSPRIQARVPFILDIGATQASINSTKHADVRTAAEHIENIRNVLNPAVADLATLFDVSRQAIYKWLTGSSNPEQDKLDRIVELSRIADAFHTAGVSRAGNLLKMKTFGGRSLMDFIKSSENRDEHVALLISEAKLMEASYKQSGLATSKSKPTSDWLSSISIPGSAERN
ncbi:MAG: hypothetical protein ACSLE5_01560 [Porticoccaceae bacterium]